MLTRWFVVALNSEPWAVGPLGIGRNKGKAFPYIGPNQKLKAYQEALAGELFGAGMTTGPVEIDIFIWRQIETMNIAGGRTRKGKPADATNIQKATEDALQGVLIENDRNVVAIKTRIVEQEQNTKACIVIAVRPSTGLDPDEIPSEIWEEIDKMQTRQPWSDPSHDPNQDILDFIAENIPGEVF